MQTGRIYILLNLLAQVALTMMTETMHSAAGRSGERGAPVDLLQREVSAARDVVYDAGVALDGSLDEGRRRRSLHTVRGKRQWAMWWKGSPHSKRGRKLTEQINKLNGALSPKPKHALFLAPSPNLFNQFSLSYFAL